MRVQPAARLKPLPWHAAEPTDHYAAVIDQRQRGYLRDLLQRWFPVRRPVQHDFACGDGRAIRLLHGLVHAAHGYDFSDAMLTRARVLGTPATLHLVAPTGPVPAFPHDLRPMIVTCTRFLTSVEPAVRDLALTFAGRALPRPDSGLLVVEHERRGGRRGAGPSPLSAADLGSLLSRHGFRVIEQRGFGVLTAGWYRLPGLRQVAAAVDGAVSWLPPLSRWCTTTFYVAAREPQSVGAPAWSRAG